MGDISRRTFTKSSCSLADKVYLEGNKPGEGTCVTEEEYEELTKEE